MKSSKRIMPLFLLGASLLFITGCGLFDLGGAGGLVIDNTAKLVSSDVPAAGSAVFNTKSITPKAAGEFRTTPANLSGDLAYAFLSLGNLGPGMFPMTWLAPAETFPYGPETGTASTVQFDLSAPAEVSGKILIPASQGEMPSEQKIIRAELSFNYVDAEFLLGSDTYTIRTVYATTAEADDVAGTMEKGDKLIKLTGETAFRWANAGQTSFTRNDVALGLIQDETVTEYIHPSEGNPDYVPVTANFPAELDVSYSLLSDTSRIWVLDFDLTDAILWSANPEELTTPQAILDAFRLKFGPNQSTTREETDDGIRAALNIQ